MLELHKDALFHFIYLFYKTCYLNGGVNCKEPSLLLSLPWYGCVKNVVIATPRRSGYAFLPTKKTLETAD